MGELALEVVESSGDGEGFQAAQEAQAAVLEQLQQLVVVKLALPEPGLTVGSDIVKEF